MKTKKTRRMKKNTKNSRNIRKNKVKKATANKSSLKKKRVKGVSTKRSPKRQSLLDDIKKGKIKDRESITLLCCKEITKTAENSKAKNTNELGKVLLKKRDEILKVVGGDPLLKNSMFFMLGGLCSYHVLDMKKRVRERYESLVHFFNEADDIIASHSAKKIKKGMHVCVETGVSAISKALKIARERKRNIKVTSFSSLDETTQKKILISCDILFIEAKIITKRSIYCSKGAADLLKEARKNKVRVYVLVNSLNYKPSLCKKREATKCKIHSKIDILDINGVISEIGHHHHKSFEDEIKARYPWLVR